MYTEEIGVSPVQGNPAGYRFYVRQLIASGRAFGIFDGNRVLFKADLGSVSGSVCQVQGVWLEPELRGQGLAAAGHGGRRPVGAYGRSDRVPLRQRLQPTCAGDIREVGFTAGRRVRDGPLLDADTCPAGSSLDRSVDDLVRPAQMPRTGRRSYADAAPTPIPAATPSTAAGPSPGQPTNSQQPNPNGPA